MKVTVAKNDSPFPAGFPDKWTFNIFDETGNKGLHGGGFRTKKERDTELQRIIDANNYEVVEG